MYTSDVFDEYITSTNLTPDHMNALKHYDNLVCSLNNVMKNPTGKDPVTTFCSNMSSSMLLPFGNFRPSAEFISDQVDINAWSLMANGQQLSPQVNNDGGVNKSMDSIFTEEELRSIEKIEGPGLSFLMELNESNQNGVSRVGPPMDYGSQQSNERNCVGLQYQQPSPSYYNFGSTQLAPHMSNIQMEHTSDSDLSSLSTPMEKSTEEEHDSTPPCSPGNPQYEWCITDEYGKKRRPLLYEFLRKLLDNRNYSHVAEYVDRRHGVFKFRERNKAAQLWELVKGRNSDNKMTYDKLARAIRYYYSSGIIRQTPGRHTYRFGSASGFGSTWKPA